MHAPKSTEEWLAEAATQSDRKLDAARIRRLRESYAVFLRIGLTLEEIKSVMAITDHEMQQVLKA